MASSCQEFNAEVPRKVPEKFNEFRLSNILCDVNIKVGNAHFTAHKVVLVEASSFFEAMFLGLVGYEGKSYEIELNDVEPDTLETVLEFLYTGKVTLTPHNGIDILLAAHLYNISSLVRVASDYISDIVDVESSVEIYHIASRLKIPNLETKAIDLVAKNIDVVTKPELVTGEMVQILSSRYQVETSKLLDLFEKWMKAEGPRADRWEPLDLFEKKDVEDFVFLEANEDQRCFFLSRKLESLKKAEAEIARLKSSLATEKENSKDQADRSAQTLVAAQNNAARDLAAAQTKATRDLAAAQNKASVEIARERANHSASTARATAENQKLTQEVRVAKNDLSKEKSRSKSIIDKLQAESLQLKNDLVMAKEEAEKEIEQQKAKIAAISDFVASSIKTALAVPQMSADCIASLRDDLNKSFQKLEVLFAKQLRLTKEDKDQ